MPVRVRVFRRVYDDVEPLPTSQWEAFHAGKAPLSVGASASRAKVELLLITTRDGVCELVEPISLDVDANGYLQRLHVRFEQLPREPHVRDARSAFLDRYLRHANHWLPSPAQIEKAVSYAIANDALEARARRIET